MYQDFSLALKPKFLNTMNSIIMPYPEFSPLLREPIAKDRLHDPRKILFYFAGTHTIGGIRRWIKRNCDASPTDCVFQSFAKNVIDASRLGVPQDYPSAMKQSVFCGHAAGDALSSRRPTSAVLAGCIPVLICDLCLYAFENMINYKAFAIFMSEDDVIQGRMLAILRSIPPKKIQQMQKNLMKVRKHFVYNTNGPPQRDDALDLLVKQLAIRGSLLRQYRRWWLFNEHLSSNAKDYPVEPPPRKKYLIKGNAQEERDFNNLG